MTRLINDVSIAATKLTIKYFEPGHSFMAADSVHGSIGTAIRSKQNIYDFHDFLEVILASRSAMEAIVLTSADQVQFISEKRVQMNQPIILHDRSIGVVEFRRGSLNMYVMIFNIFQ